QLVTEFTRDRLHREVRRTQGAREQLRQYDSLGRRTLQRSELSTNVTLPEQTLLERLYRYTARGELSGVSDTLRGEVDYGYDAEGRLLKHYEARQGHSRAQFSYDAADNLAANDDAVPVTDNRLQHWQALFMKYDHWGNLVSRRNGLYEQHYVYDAENRLVSARGTGPEGRFEARYHYDALGRRTRKIVTTAHGTSDTRFLWQGYRLLQEQQNAGQCSTYIYDPNEAWSPLARVDHLRDQSSGEIYWFNTDLNGAPLEVTDEHGAVRWSGQYGSFGEVRHQSEGFSRVVNRTAMAHQPLRYAGQYADGETGLHYNLFRYYDPQVGRFIVQDPIGLNGGWNLYQYAPNPLGWIDPLGLSFGTGKGTHTAHATLFDSEGNVKAQGIWQSGNMTPEEKALGFPQSSLATHTEARITRELDQIASPGDKLVIDGQYPPCTSCRGKMNTFKLNTGADVVYNWPSDTGQINEWQASGKKSARRKNCSG
ncbi:MULTISPECIES: RHS repeat-associated core domain-containing protein, partial [unclassified Enterobacter]